MNKNKCEKKGHKYKPRYDKKFPHGLTNIRGYDDGTINALKEIIYVRDICVRCGETVERKD